MTQVIQCGGCAPPVIVEEPKVRYNMQSRHMTRCQSDDDGYCEWAGCPQLRDDEPKTSGRHCPLDARPEEDEAS